MIICDEKKTIGYISESCIGKKHDYALLKEKFPINKKGFVHFIILVD